MIQICLNKKCSYTDANGIFLSDPYNFSVGYGYKTNFPCRNRSFLRATTDPNAIFYRRTVV